MADEGSFAVDYKNLYDLRVIDLKKELEKRGLSKSGSKKELVERLKTQLKLEELREKSKSSSEGAQVPSIQLSEGGQNEFVKNYLQQREKLFEQQMEQKKKYQEEASRSQESESQSETDEGTKSEKHDICSPEKLSVVQEKRGKQEEEDEEKDTETADTGLMETDSKDTETVAEEANKDASGEVQRRSRYSSGSSRSRSSSSSTSRSRDRSASGGSRSDGDEKRAAALPKKASHSRSTAEVEVRSRSGSPVDLSATKKRGGASPNPQGKRIRRSRSASSSDSKAEGKKRPEVGTKDAKRGRSESESTDRSSRSRSRSSSSDESNEDSPKKRRSDDRGEPQQIQRGSNSRSRSRLSSNTNDVEKSETGAQKKKPSQISPRDESETSATRAEIAITPIDVETDSNGNGNGDGLSRRASDAVESKTEGKQEQQNGKSDQIVEGDSVKGQVTLSRSQMESDNKNEDCEVKPTRKRRWGSTTLKTLTGQPSINISTESLKALIPEMKVDIVLMDVLPEIDNPDQEEEEVLASAKGAAEQERDAGGDVGKQHFEAETTKRQVIYKTQESVSKQKTVETTKLGRTIFQTVKTGNDNNDALLEKPREAVDASEAPRKSEENLDETSQQTTEVQTQPAKIAEVRRTSRPQVPLIPVDDPQPVGRRSPSPARNLATHIVHIHRLVRPYTLGQLKELLSQTGTMVENGFWIDKIKSHCLVVYNTVDEAIATRRLLHGKRWPMSNPQILRVEYATQEEFDMFKNAKDGVQPIKPLVKPEELQEKKQQEERTRPAGDRLREPERTEPAKLLGRDGRARPKERTPPIREWDRDKIRQSRSRSRDRERREATDRGARREKENNRERLREERRKRRASSPDHKVKKEKIDDEPPAKLLDDLFRKTKATPCIYWLPLTEEQIMKKVAAQQQAEAERERRRLEREQQAEEERNRAKEERMARETKREDRRPDRRERPGEGRQRLRESAEPGKRGGAMSHGERTGARH